MAVTGWVSVVRAVVGLTETTVGVPSLTVNNTPAEGVLPGLDTVMVQVPRAKPVRSSPPTVIAAAVTLVTFRLRVVAPWAMAAVAPVMKRAPARVSDTLAWSCRPPAGVTEVRVGSLESTTNPTALES